MSNDPRTGGGANPAGGDLWKIWTENSARLLGLAGPAKDVEAYCVDAFQRMVLFWDVMRQRGNNYVEHNEKVAPHVLSFDCDLLVDGRTLSRPVNYALARIEIPPEGDVDPRKRAFVVFDPRAGHGPGIGGFKADSEIGVALKAGHPCYFVGFLPEPMPGQTIEDIMRAEAVFLERVIELHPKAEGKPAIIGNCQAGWAIMMLASIRPELFGPIIIAGSPLSYWAGVRGQNPLRYMGGLLGGSWLTALAGDLGGGKFDGASLVQNFENLNPANTYWKKPYDLYSKIDTEADRYLDFEQWWGGHVLLNAEEMQFIVDKLFVGNKLATGEIATSDGQQIDLRNIRSPILVFCSKGDNITPPQQALGWISDLYTSVDDIRSHGQTIVYAVHETVGHLGIFVSGGVAKKEHDEFASNIDLIDVLPPGLYEAVMTPKNPDDPTSDLISGDYLVRFEARDLDDIRALGGNNVEDERRFAAAARVSEMNLEAYRTFVQPWIRAFTTPDTAEWMRRLHPLRLQYELASDANPVMRQFSALAEAIRQNRQPAPADNPLLQAQAAASEQIEKTLKQFGELRDHVSEAAFLTIYGSPILQAAVGLASSENPRHQPGKNPEHQSFVDRRIEELKARIGEGGPREATIRALLYIRIPDGAADERGLVLLRRIRDEHGGDLTLPAFKQLVRDQFLTLWLDEERAVEAIPAMLARDRARAEDAGDSLRRVIEAVGLKTDEARSRLAEIEKIFADLARTPVSEMGPAGTTSKSSGGSKNERRMNLRASRSQHPQGH